jgi:hypothetical protein
VSWVIIWPAGLQAIAPRADDTGRMNPNAPRSRSRNAEADAYWRRRFFTLLAGLGVLGLLAWAFSGTVSGTPHQGPGSGQPGAANASAAAYGTAAPGQPAGSATTPTAPPSGQASVFLPASSPSPKPSAPAPARARKNAATGPSRKSAQAATARHTCPAHDIVLTLLASKTSYGPAELPKFQVDIVSTDAAACTLNVGRQSLRVLITSGSRATWDSGACLRGATAHVERLRRGIPVVVSITWNRRLRAGGCSKAALKAARGRYVAMAVAGSVVSQAKGFRLR